MKLARFRFRMSALSMRAKLLSGTGILFLMVIGLSASGLKSSSLLASSVSQVSSNATAADWLAQAASSRLEMLQYLWAGAANYKKGHPLSESQTKDFLTPKENFTNLIAKYVAESSLSPNEKALADKVTDQWKPIAAKVDALTADFAAGKAAPEDLVKRVNEISEESLNINDSLSEITGELRQKGTEATDAAKTLQSRIQIMALATAWVFSLVSASAFLSSAFQQLLLASSPVSAPAPRLSPSLHDRSLPPALSSPRVQPSRRPPLKKPRPAWT